MRPGAPRNTRKALRLALHHRQLGGVQRRDRQGQGLLVRDHPLHGGPLEHPLQVGPQVRPVARAVAVEGCSDQYVRAFALGDDAIWRETEAMMLEALKASLVSNGAIWIVHRKGKDATLRDVEVFAAGRRAGEATPPPGGGR